MLAVGADRGKRAVAIRHAAVRRSRDADDRTRDPVLEKDLPSWISRDEREARRFGAGVEPCRRCEGDPAPIAADGRENAGAIGRPSPVRHHADAAWLTVRYLHGVDVLE